MLALTALVPLLLASAGDCYLVTNESIRTIPCDFSAATTDALRYAAEDAGGPRRPEPEMKPRVDPMMERYWRRGKSRRPSRSAGEE